LLDALLGSAITIDAGGGVVYNENDEVLLILRRGKWDLPKGKLDPGESIIDCALREVIEETGLKNLTLLDKLTSSMYCYREKGQLVLKQVQWYKMRTADRHQLTPQAEEDITEIKWINLQELDPYLQNTYDTIKEVLLLAQRSPNRIG
jgi:8-oxo-dGTP pyrophosphatase MutT (NUDIX family)